MLHLLSDVFPMLMLCSWRTFMLLSPVLSAWISLLTHKSPPPVHTLSQIYPVHAFLTHLFKIHF